MSTNHNKRSNFCAAFRRLLNYFIWQYALFLTHNLHFSDCSVDPESLCRYVKDFFAVYIVLSVWRRSLNYVAIDEYILD